MIRPIFITIVLLCLPAVSLAVGNAQIDIRYGYGDTVWSAAAASFDIWAANDVMSGGFQFPITLSSPDGVAWEWNSQPSG